MQLGRFLLPLLLLAAPAHAQRATVITACGTPPGPYAAGEQRPILQNTDGELCVEASGIAAGAPTDAPYYVTTANAGLSAEVVPSANVQTLLGAADFAAFRLSLGMPSSAATYITQTADSTLSAEQAMGALATGIVKNTTTTGVQSIAVAGVDYVNPFKVFIAGRIYPAMVGTVGAGAALTVNVAKFVPFVIEKPLTMSDIVVRITTLAAGGNIQMAIYANDPATLRPTGSPLAATGSQVTDAASVFVVDIAGSNVAFTPGIYWAAINADNSTVVMQINATANTYFCWLIGTTAASDCSAGSASSGTHLTTPLTFGTWGDLTGATWTVTTGLGHFFLFFKAA